MELMKYRKLRIAFSAVCGVLCLLLIALWVRSYWKWDSPHGPISSTRWMQINSIRGYLFVGIGEQASTGNGKWKWRSFRARSLTDTGATGTVAWSFTRKVGVLGCGVVESNGMRFVYLAYWFLAALMATLAVSPWVRWKPRFSLRTLLIATTLVAILLGLIVYAAS
jgi:hypothetical protein